MKKLNLNIEAEDGDSPPKKMNLGLNLDSLKKEEGVAADMKEKLYD